jgi:hypothetical protein
MKEKILVERDAGVATPPRRMQHDIDGKHRRAQALVARIRHWRFDSAPGDLQLVSHKAAGLRRRPAGPIGMGFAHPPPGVALRIRLNSAQSLIAGVPGGRCMGVAEPEDRRGIAVQLTVPLGDVE